MLYLPLISRLTSTTVRKAYKKRALQTHPDRLPQGATAADKSDSDEKFRRVRQLSFLCSNALTYLQVNNAYEVLSDPAKRKASAAHSISAVTNLTYRSMICSASGPLQKKSVSPLERPAEAIKETIALITPLEAKPSLTPSTPITITHSQPLNSLIHSPCSTLSSKVHHSKLGLALAITPILAQWIHSRIICSGCRKR